MDVERVIDIDARLKLLEKQFGSLTDLLEREEIIRRSEIENT